MLAMPLAAYPCDQKCFGKNDCITKQELADLKDPSKGRKFYTIFKDSLPRDYRHPEVMAARLVELYRKYENVVDTTGRKLFGKVCYSLMRILDPNWWIATDSM